MTKCPTCGQQIPEPQPAEPEWFVWQWIDDSWDMSVLAQGPGTPTRVPDCAVVVHRFHARDYDAAVEKYQEWKIERIRKETSRAS